MLVNAVLATEAQINTGVATGSRNVQIFIDFETNELKALYPDGIIRIFDIATGTFIVAP